MKSFADFSIPNGDRDLDDEELIDDVPVEIEESPSVLPPQETKNLVVKKIANNQGDGKRIKIETMPIPRAFDLQYYQDKIDKANFNSDRIGAIRAIAIKRYADIAYEFYRQVMYVFNKKNNIVAMPEYVKMCEKIPGNVEALAQAMIQREQDLIKAFGGSDKLKSTFKERKHLTELKQFSAQAWIMYVNLTSLKDFIGELVKNENTYNKADKTNHSHVANLYGLHVQAGYYIDANIKNFFSVGEKGLMSIKCPDTCYFYNDLNSMDEFNSILKEKNAYIYNDKHDEIVGLAKNVLNSSEEKTLNKRIIGYYNHYRDMKYIKHQMRRVDSDVKYIGSENPYPLNLFEDYYNTEEKYKQRDVYFVAYKYYLSCKNLVEKLPVKSKIYRDVCDMCVELEELLYLNEDAYIKYQDENKKTLEKVLESRPHLKEQFEEEEKNKKNQDDTISSI